MMCESSRQRLQHTSASQVVRAVEQSRAFLARELVTMGEPNLIYYWNFYSWAIFFYVCGTHVVGCCDTLSSVTVDLERLEESRAFPARELVTMGEPN